MQRKLIEPQRKGKKCLPPKKISNSQKFCAKSEYAVTSFNKLAQLPPLVKTLLGASCIQPIKHTKKTNVKKPKNAKFCHFCKPAGFNYVKEKKYHKYTDENGDVIEYFILEMVNRWCWLKFIPITNDILINEAVKLGYADYHTAAKFQNQLKKDTLEYVWENHGEITNEILKIEDKKKLEKKAKAKFFNSIYINHLIELESPLKKSYELTNICSSELYQNGYKITSRYCKQRWCTVCNRIRTATLMNGYLPQLQTFNKPAFLTLTLKNCHRLQLPSHLRLMQKVWRFIYKKLTKQVKRKTNPIPYELKGIKKLECTYNFVTDEYHPHFHFIFSSYEMAEIVKAEWLKYFNDAGLSKTVDAKGQKNILIDKTTPEKFNGSLKELFKYFTKIISKTNEIEYIKTKEKNSINTTTTKKELHKICIPALDIIFNSMYKRRVYEPIGIRAIKEDINELMSEKYSHLIYQTKVWSWSGEDWFCEDNTPLTEYKHNNEFTKLAGSIIY